MSLRDLRERARELGIAGWSKLNTAQAQEAIAAAEGGEQAQQPLEAEPEPAHFEPVEVRNEQGGRVTVLTRGAQVQVRWLCGAERTFAPEDLRLAIDRFELVSKHGAWFEDDDSHRQTYAAELQDGDFHADDHVNGRQGAVPWEPFKAALESAIVFQQGQQPDAPATS